MQDDVKRTTVGLLVLILLVGALLRLPNLETAPPGLHYDEAANAILAAEIGLKGERPIFISSYTGKEVLYFYLAGGLMRLVGPSVFTLRLTSAFVGLLTIATTYWLGRELTRDRRLALIAAMLMAVSFWHLVFSRLGFRAVTQPLLQGLAVAALWRGFRRDSWRWLLFGGVALGLTAYTYLAARLFPVALLIGFLPFLISRSRQRWGQMVVVGGVALAVLAPLLRYFWVHPDAFWVRISQVSPTETISLGESIGRSLGMFFLQGDPYIRFNVPFRPLFDWFWGALLVAGWLVCLVWVRRVRAGWQRGGLLLLTAVPFIMLLPTALATGEIVPSNLRAIGLMPFIFLLPAVGLLALVTDLVTRFQLGRVATAVYIVGLAALVTGGWQTYRVYFQQWAVQPDLFYASDGDLALAADFLDSTLVDDRPVYVSALHYQHPTVAFLSERYDQVKWVVNSEALVLPPSGQALYVYPFNSPVPTWQRPFLDTAVRFESSAGPANTIPYTVYEMSRPEILSIPHAVNANFGYAVTLLGYDTAPAAAGETLPVTIYWEVQAAPGVDWVPFVHLEDAWGTRWAQVEAPAYPAAQWQTGEIVIQRLELPVPVGTPPGFYRLRVGWFDAASGSRLARLDENGRFAGDTQIIENIAIEPGKMPEPVPQPPIADYLSVRKGLTLLGHEPLPPDVSTGERLPFTLWWLAVQPQPDLTLRLELYPPDRRGFILADFVPVHGTYPFANWAVPQFVKDRQAVVVDDDVPPGQYQVQLRVLDGAGASLATAELGQITVNQTERLFTPPDTQFPHDATLGGEIKLVGYDLRPLPEAGHYELRLVWRALAAPSADYTVFVHLLDVDGRCCIWQDDVMPVAGTYPTSRWLPEEVVVDSYQIVLPDDLPPGVYPIEVGLYLADSGQRLQVVVPGLPDSDVVLLRPLQVDD